MGQLYYKASGGTLVPAGGYVINDTTKVSLSGNETINGDKTFTGSTLMNGVLTTFAGNVLVSGTNKLYIGNATGGYKGEIRSQSNYPIVLMPYDNSGAALSGAEFYYSTGGNTWNSEVGLNVGGAVGITNSSGANSISLSSTDGDALVNVQAGGASGNYGYLRLRSKWGQASQNELHSGIDSDGSWFVSQKTINGSSVSRDNLLHVSSGGEITFNPVNSVQINGRLIFPSTKSIRLRAGNVSTGTDEYELMGYSDGNLWLTYNNPFSTYVRDLAMFKPDGTFHLAQPGYGIEYGSAGPRHMVYSSDPTGIDVPVGSTWRQTSANSTYGNLTGLLWNKVGTGTTLGTDWLVDFEGRWVDYTPTISGWTIGSGTSTGRYTRRGNLATVRCQLVLNSTTVAATLNFSTPTGLTPAISAHGSARLADTGTKYYYGVATANTTGLIAVNVAGTNGAQVSMSSTVPHTWANSDTVIAFVTYEIA